MTQTMTFDQSILTKAMETLNKQYGVNTIQNLEDGGHALEVIGFGDPILDFGLSGAADRGGVPKGKIIEIYGPESSGKTTLALLLLSMAQKMDPRAALVVDAEHALDKGYAAHLGVQIPRTIINQPDTGKEAMTSIKTLVASGQVSFVILDSWAALITEDEANSDEVGDKKVGGSARLSSVGLKQLAVECNKHNCTLVICNQVRTKITPMGSRGTQSTGGFAMKFTPSLRLEIKPMYKGKANVLDGRILKIVKSKCQAPVFAEIPFYMGFGIGVDSVKNLASALISEGIIVQAGSHFNYTTEAGDKVQLGQGMDKLAENIRDDSALRMDLCSLAGFEFFTPRTMYNPNIAKLKLLPSKKKKTPRKKKVETVPEEKTAA